MATRSRKAANIWVARFIPVILLGLIGYSAYVITKVVAIDYLIQPPPELVQPRPGSAAAILFFYYILLIPLLVCYIRLLYTVTTNPGYVPRTAAWYQQREEEAKRGQKHTRKYHRRRRPSSHITEKASQPGQLWPAANRDPESASSNHSSLTTSKEYQKTKPLPHHKQATDIPFWHRSIFLCNSDGRPRLCSTCLTPKLDRTHHCSEVDRCVLKMDHFCPWVGGMVSETSFKFFIQFLVYAASFCVVVLTTISVFIAERRRNEGPGFLELHYYLILAISALFLLFSAGMAASSIQLALINSTTVENLNRRTKVWFLAVLIPRLENGQLPPLYPPLLSSGPNSLHVQTVTYPRPPEEEIYNCNQAPSRGGPTNFNTPPINTNPVTPTPPRTFAILATQPGENPFDIDPWTNICDVMGHTISEWLFPWEKSPCAYHESEVSAFRINEGLIRRLQEEAGLVKPTADRAGGSRRDDAGVGGDGDGESESESAFDARITRPSPAAAAAADYGDRRKRRRGRRGGSGGSGSGSRRPERNDK